MLYMSITEEQINIGIQLSEDLFVLIEFIYL